MDFHLFSDRGTVWDAEAFAGKGVAWVRLEPAPGVTVDVVNTHTIAHSASSNNTWYRLSQVHQLLDVVSSSPAHAVILGGDLNSSPSSSEHDLLGDIFSDALEDSHTQEEIGACCDLTTFANPRNTFAGVTEAAPQLVDYIFHMANKYKFQYPIQYTFFQTIIVSDLAH